MRSRGKTRRGFFLVLDTAAVAATNAGVLVLAARSLAPAPLSDFSLMLLVLTTAVALQRASFLTPAFAAQRVHGQSGIPLRWLLLISLPVSLAAAFLVLLTLHGDGDSVAWGWAVVGAALPTISNDVLRSHLIGAGSPHYALCGDIGIALTAGIAFLALGSEATVPVLTAVYAVAMCIGSVIFVSVVVVFKTHRRLPLMTLRKTWRLGKWSGLDNLMSAIANLVPMFATTLVLGYDFAGTYRVLQASLGPLNILSTSIVTSFGLDSWQLKTRADVAALRSRVGALCIRLIGFATVYLVLGEVAVSWISNLRGDDVLRIATIVGVAGLMTAASIPFQAGALALGYQKSGAFIRVFVLTFSITVTVGGVASSLLPWGDPIAAVSLFAAIVSLLGWSIAFSRAHKREDRLAPE